MKELIEEMLSDYKKRARRCEKLEGKNLLEGNIETAVRLRVKTRVYRSVAADLRRLLKNCKEDSLEVHDIRNKLSSLTTLISIFKNEKIEPDLIDSLVNQSKKSINYLAKRDVFKL